MLRTSLACALIDEHLRMHQDHEPNFFSATLSCLRVLELVCLRKLLSLDGFRPSIVEAEALLAARILLRERQGAESLMDNEVCTPYSETEMHTYFVYTYLR